jgi:CBS domain-containing protein
MKQITHIEDIMTKDVITLKPDESLFKAAELFDQYRFDGIPVVDGDRRLVGLVGSYDMILQTRLHLPNILGVLGQGSVHDMNEHLVDLYLKRLKRVHVGEIMNKDPLVVHGDVQLEDLVGEFAEHHRVNPIPVINAEKQLIGVVSRYDVIRFFSKHFLLDVLQDAGHHGILQRLSRIDTDDDEEES